jgi:hypothetical protein
LEEVGVGGRITLKWILNRMEGRVMDLFVSGQGQGEGSWEHGSDPWDSVKWDEFIDGGESFSFCTRIMLHEVSL